MNSASISLRSIFAVIAGCAVCLVVPNAAAVLLFLGSMLGMLLLVLLAPRPTFWFGFCFSTWGATILVGGFLQSYLRITHGRAMWQLHALTVFLVGALGGKLMAVVFKRPK